MSGLNLHIYFSPMVHESRMFKITRSLKLNGVFDRIIIAGSKRSDLPSNETLAEGVKIYRMGLVRGFSGGVHKAIAFIWYCFSVLTFAIKNKPACVNVHSLTLIPVGLLIKLFLPKVCLIYDAHELETETNGSSALFTFVKRGIERLSIGFFRHSFDTFRLGLARRASELSRDRCDCSYNYYESDSSNRGIRAAVEARLAHGNFQCLGEQKVRSGAV